MDWIRILLSRCAALFHRRQLDGELDEELLAHIDLATAENRKRGMPEEEARTTALREFGGVIQAKEQYRVQRGLPILEVLGQDVSFGFRQLRRSPGSRLFVYLRCAWASVSTQRFSASSRR